MFVLSLFVNFQKILILTHCTQHLAHNTNVLLREARDNGIRFRYLKMICLDFDIQKVKAHPYKNIGKTINSFQNSTSFRQNF